MVDTLYLGAYCKQQAEVLFFSAQGSLLRRALISALSKMWRSECSVLRSKHLFLISCVRIAMHHLSLSTDIGTWGNLYTGISKFWIPSKHTGKINQDSQICSSFKCKCQRLRWVPHWKFQHLGFCPHRLMGIGRQVLSHWFLSTDFPIPMNWLSASFICWRHSKGWVMCTWKVQSSPEKQEIATCPTGFESTKK